MSYARLPVSGAEVWIEEPGGSEDLLLLEAPADAVRLALTLAARLARTRDGAALDGETLSVSDLDALLLLLRRRVLGDVIRADVACSAKACGARVDIAFRVGEYLAHHRPRVPRGVEAENEPGRFRIGETGVSFRLPTALDLTVAAGQSAPDRALVGRCVRPAGLPARVVRRVQAAMEALAPSLCHELEGTCPECGARIAVYFDPQQFCLEELRNHAAFIYQEIHLLARTYHWSEAEILALPRSRRHQYAEMVRQEGSLQ